jgi:hypothetical protein
LRISSRAENEDLLLIQNQNDEIDKNNSRKDSLELEDIELYLSHMQE